MSMNASATELDDVKDREELRTRYYGLMQELRVMLPGVQILVAFLLTVPFASGWRGAGSFEKACFATALAGGCLSIISFVTPTAIHRLGDPRERSNRLAWSIRLTVAGLAFFGVALAAAVMLVTSEVFGTTAAWWVGAAAAVFMGSLWVWLPRIVTGTDPG